MDLLTILLFFVTIILALALFFIFRYSQRLQAQLDELAFSKQSQSVKYGKMTEQWIPFSKEFPFDSWSFRFIGTPIDGIAFEDDKITFVEIKSASSQLTEKQRRIKELVQSKKIGWLEFRAD